MVFHVKGLYGKCLLEGLNKKNGQDSHEGHGALEFILNQLPNQSRNLLHVPTSHTSPSAQFQGQDNAGAAESSIVGQLELFPAGEGLPRVSLSG